MLLYVGVDGCVVFGVGCDEVGLLQFILSNGNCVLCMVCIFVILCDWLIECVNGVLLKMVNLFLVIVVCIMCEQVVVMVVCICDDFCEDFLCGFVWLVYGWISGCFGNQCIYNGELCVLYLGMDIVVLVGMLVCVLVFGVVIFVVLVLYFIGGMVLIDYGFGLSLNFLYLLVLKVYVGEWVW